MKSTPSSSGQTEQKGVRRPLCALQHKTSWTASNDCHAKLVAKRPALSAKSATELNPGAQATKLLNIFGVLLLFLRR